MQRAIETERFIRKIRLQCHKKGMRCPPLPDLKSTVMIHARLSCKTCGNGVGSMQKGFNFTCDDCGRDNFFLPNGSLKVVKCEHCNSRFEAIHFMNRSAHDEDDDE